MGNTDLYPYIRQVRLPENREAANQLFALSARYLECFLPFVSKTSFYQNFVLSKLRFHETPF